MTATDTMWNMHADGLSPEEIAQRTGLTVRQVKGRLRNALAVGPGRPGAYKGTRSTQETREIDRNRNSIERHNG